MPATRLEIWGKKMEEVGGGGDAKIIRDRKEYHTQLVATMRFHGSIFDLTAGRGDYFFAAFFFAVYRGHSRE